MACGDDRDILREMYPTYGYSPAPDCEDLVDASSYVNPGNLPFSELSCEHPESVEAHSHQWDNTVSDTFQDIRNEFGSGIKVTSAFRCPLHNENASNIGSDSAHAYGNAFDFQQPDSENWIEDYWAIAMAAKEHVPRSQILLYKDTDTYMTLAQLEDGGYDDTNLPSGWSTYRKGHVTTN